VSAPRRRRPTQQSLLEQYANNSAEADHGRLKARLRPMRGLKSIRSLRTVAAGHAFVQNLRRGHYELTADLTIHDRVRVAFTELASCLLRPDRKRPRRGSGRAASDQGNSAFWALRS
jgi:DDE domain